VPEPPRLRLGVAYDFRNPAGSALANAELYAQILTQVELVDRLGFDLVWLTEHHFVDDGYLPAFAPVAGAIAARTSRVRISTDIALLPFHHPLRLAEDVAVLDNLSGGRIELGVGMGYAAHEFAAFGVPKRERVSRTEEAVAILRQAWSEQPVRFRGKRFTFDGVNVFPKPVQPGGIPLWMAAQSEAGARRAGELGLNLLPQGTAAHTIEPWRRALAEHGHEAATRRIGIIRPWLVTDDRARDWPPIRAGERYKTERYREWAASSGDSVADFADPARIPQTWIVGDANHVARELGAFVREYGLTDVVTWAAPPGVPPAAMSPSLERFAREVMPRLR
jgi:alkanesulfonate monooxygenase SsuD/methylene tetrahydromethanopterin reductase-like flavin-dependent oxidoreductase (luciferase family)